jgi:uncharacterized RDD family membrane protein YckC
MAAPIPAGRRLAGPFSRLLGLIIDNLVLGVMTLPLTLPGVLMVLKGLEDCEQVTDGSAVAVECTEDTIQVGWMIGGIALLIVGFLVLVWIYARWLGKGATPGMRITGNRLVDVNSGLPIGTGRGFGRALFANLISSSLCALGYLWALWDGRRQTWHDKVVGSVVVKAD